MLETGRASDEFLQTKHAESFLQIKSMILNLQVRL